MGKGYGGTMRLGSFPCKLAAGTISRRAYAKEVVHERHRHRYEFNNAYRKKLEAVGLKISGTSLNGRLVEIIELPKHPFFIGTQFHPEFTSRPFRSHPLYLAFINACCKVD